MYLVFQDMAEEQEKLAAFMKVGAVYVCKPLLGQEGEGGKLHCDTLEKVEAAWFPWKDKYQHFY